MNVTVQVANELHELFRDDARFGLAHLRGKVDALRSKHGDDVVVTALVVEHATLIQQTVARAAAVE